MSNQTIYVRLPIVGDLISAAEVDITLTKPYPKNQKKSLQTERFHFIETLRACLKILPVGVELEKESG